MRWPGAGILPQQVADVVDEAQIEHAVGLVQHHHLDVVELVDALFVVVDQAAGGADQHVHPGFELAALAVVAGAAEYDDAFEAGIAAEQFGVAVDLHRQFAGRRDDDGPGTGRVLGDGGFHQVMQGGEQKGGGLAGASLGLAGDILAFERQRQGGGLNRRAVDKAGVLHAFLQRIGQAERGKRDVGQMIGLHGLAIIPSEQGGGLRERPVWAEMS